MNARMVVTNRPHGRRDMTSDLKGSVDTLQQTARHIAEWEPGSSVVLYADDGELLFRAGRILDDDAAGTS